MMLPERSILTLSDGRLGPRNAGCHIVLFHTYLFFNWFKMGLKVTKNRFLSILEL